MLTTGWAERQARRDTAFHNVGRDLSHASRALSPPTTPRCSNRALPARPQPELRAAGDKAFAVLRGAAEHLVTAAALAASARPP